MTEAAKKARAAYMREWRSKNRERCKQYAINQWERRAERMAREQADRKEAQHDDNRRFPPDGNHSAGRR